MRRYGQDFTHHARQRMQQRAIPPGVVELIQDFGQSWDAGNGATSHALTKQSFREIKRSYGRSIAEALAPYRDAYVIAKGALVITAARTNCPRFE
jgi:hypothetical protein